MTRRRWMVPWALGLAVFTLPAAVEVPGVGLDPSWIVAMSMAYRSHLQWGTEVLWTYGPYGFLASLNYYYFGTWLAALAATLAIHLALFLVLAAYLKHVGAKPWLWLLVGAVFFLPVVSFLTLEYEGVLVVTLLLFLAGVTPAPRRAIGQAAIAGVLVALLLTVKTTFMAIAAGLLLPYVVYLVATRRTLVLVPLLGMGSATFVLLWLAAGQPLAGIAAYARSSYEIIAGYTAAMSVLYDYPVRHVASQIAVGALVVVSSGLALVWSLVRRDRDQVCLLILASPLLFFMFKEGFVRFGDRQLFFYSLATIIEVLVLVWATGGRRGPSSSVAAVQAGVSALVVACLVGGMAYAAAGVHIPPRWPFSDVRARLASYGEAADLIQHPERQLAFTSNTKAAMRTYYGLSPQRLSEPGGIDVLPWDIDVVYAYGLAWDPRPVLASYAAYTPYLDQLDAQHLDGPNAPAHLLVRSESIDGRYPPFDEPAVLRSIASNYRVDGPNGSMLALSRHGSAAQPRLHRFATAHVHLGDQIPVPNVASGQVFAVVRVPYSARGGLMNLVFQPEELRLQFRLSDGDSQVYRFVPSVAENGLLVSTFIGSNDDLVAYIQGHPVHPIRAFRISSDRGGADYIGTVDVTFYAVG